MDKNDADFFRGALQNGLHLKTGVYRGLLGKVFKQTRARYCKEVLSYLLSDNFKNFEKDARHALQIYSGWDILSEYLDKGYIDASEVSVANAVKSLFVESFSIESYFSVAEIYNFSESDAYSRQALSTVVELLSSCYDTDKFSCLNRYDTDFDSSRYIGSLRELLKLHVDEFEISINDVTKSSVFL